MGSGVELETILTGEGPIPYRYAYRAGGTRLNQVIAGIRPGARMLVVPSLAFVVRHPSGGTLLIDTGLHADANGHLRRDFGLAMSVMFRGLRPATEPFDEQLRTRGNDPETVERVIMTHLHVDHTSGMRLLPHAEFTCSIQEWSAAHTSIPATNGYVRHHLPEASRMDLLDLDRDGEPHESFTKTLDLLGDGSVRLIWTPGHTAGHLSVLLRLADGRRVLLVGDAAYTLRNIREQILAMITADDDASIRSLAELKAFAEQAPEAVLVPSHDPDAWRQLSQLDKRERVSVRSEEA